MKIGCCVKVQEIESAKNAGYDYIELPVVSAAIPESPESEWKAIRSEIQKHGIIPEAWNVLMPGEIPVTGPNVNFERAKKYLTSAFQRIREVGGEVVVFGSGKSRGVPEGYPMENAKKQLNDFLKMAGDLAYNKALRLVIEPLNRKECNIIQTVEEGLGYARALNHPSVGVLVDFYHLDEEKEPMSHIVDARHYMMHVHTADTGRRFPGSGHYDYEGFLGALRQIDYNDRISVECNWGDDPDAERKAACEFLKSLVNP